MSQSTTAIAVRPLVANRIRLASVRLGCTQEALATFAGEMIIGNLRRHVGDDRYTLWKGSTRVKREAAKNLEYVKLRSGTANRVREWAAVLQLPSGVLFDACLDIISAQLLRDQMKPLSATRGSLVTGFWPHVIKEAIRKTVQRDIEWRRDNE